ncbi:hypothetical protein A3K63_02155 [Candidatus Micrarchaeota archaeon RBG_16_49_10]|nr:MAG: hypothetical protein A3K63_02155 [Candidatus Micrarchaeota archaeon RBG_16_49_10]
MIENIIDSKVKMKIAKVFVRDGGDMHVSEVARVAKISKSRASECLREMADKGLLESRVVGRNTVYSLSSTSLSRNVMAALKQDENLLDEISKAFVNEIKKLKSKPVSVALFGSASEELKIGSDVDFFVVGGWKEKFYEVAAGLTQKLGVRISVLVMGKDELIRKTREGEEFVINILANHNLLYGKKLEELIW